MDHDLPEKIDYPYIKYCLAKKDYSLKKIADDLGLFGPQCIQQVLTRKYVSARVEKYASEIIDITLEKLFPDRYQALKNTEKKLCPRRKKSI